MEGQVKTEEVFLHCQRRICALSAFPASDERAQAILDAFTDACVSDAHAMAVADDLEQYWPDHKNPPVPNDVRDKALELRPRFDRTPAVCPHCEGNRVVHVASLDCGDYAAPCRCVTGKVPAPPRLALVRPAVPQAPAAEGLQRIRAKGVA